MSEIHSRLQELTKPPSSRRSTTPVKRASQVGGASTATRPKSQSSYPTSKEELNKSEEMASRRASAYKPRRPAPTKPAPARPAPGKPTNNTSTFPRSKGKGTYSNSQEEPLVIANNENLYDNEPQVGVASGQSYTNKPKTSKSDNKRNKPQESAGGQGSQAKKDGQVQLSSYKRQSDSTEALLSKSLQSNDRGAKKTTPSTATTKSKSLSRHDPLGAKKNQPATKKTETAAATKKPVKYSARNLERNKRELPRLREMEQAVQDEQAMADEEDDFILEPPQRFSQDDDLETEEPVVPLSKPQARRESNIERKIQAKKSGKFLNRMNTPSNLALPNNNDDDDDYDDIVTPKPDNTDHDYDDILLPEDVDQDVVLPNEGWESDDGEEEYRFDESNNGFDHDYDEPEAMEEDELPEVVYDEDVAALIW